MYQKQPKLHRDSAVISAIGLTNRRVSLAQLFQRAQRESTDSNWPEHWINSSVSDLSQHSSSYFIFYETKRQKNLPQPQSYTDLCLYKFVCMQSQISDFLLVVMCFSAVTYVYAMSSLVEDLSVAVYFSLMKYIAAPFLSQP